MCYIYLCSVETCNRRTRTPLIRSVYQESGYGNSMPPPPKLGITKSFSPRGSKQLLKYFGYVIENIEAPGGSSISVGGYS